MMDWKVRVCRMAVSPSYPTPYCALATCEHAPGKVIGFNKEGRTEQEAIDLAVREINQGGIYERLVGSTRTKRA